MIAWFISDLHAGIHQDTDEEARLHDFRQLLKQIARQGGELFLLGDIFDFWYEKSGAVPERHIPWLASMRELADAGVSVHWFPGNHDFLAGPALARAGGLQVEAELLRREIQGHSFVLHHGDGLDPQEKNYLLLKRVLRNPLLQFLFRCLPLRLGMWLGDRISDTDSRDCTTWGSFELDAYMQRALPLVLRNTDEYFVMGHAHRPLLMSHGDTQIAVLPPFLSQARGYGRFDGEHLELCCLHPEFCPPDWIPFIRKG